MGEIIITKKRQEHDFYSTPPEAVEALLSSVKLPTHIWEPCCGDGGISKVLEAHGHQVLSTDLFDYNFGQAGVDFLLQKQMPNNCNCIVTNFPFNNLNAMVAHALEILPDGGLLCSLQRTQTVEGIGRYRSIYSVHPPKEIFQFIKRLSFGDYKATDNSGYAWFIFEKAWLGKPTIGWIDNTNN